MAVVIVGAFSVGTAPVTVSAPAPRTISVTVNCSTTATEVVSTAVAKDDNLQINFSDTSCNGASVDKFNNFTSITATTVSGSTSITAGQRKQYSALSSPKTTLATVTLGGVTVTIENAPVTETTTFTSDSPTDGTVGASYSYTFAADGGPNYYEVASGSLPTGLSLNSDTGVLSGTPTAAASYTFAVKATNLVTDTVVTGTSNTVVISDVAPSAPATVSASAGNAQVTVEVTGASSGGVPTQFNVTGSPSGSCTITSLSGSGSAKTGSCTISSLTNGTAYTFSATAQNSVGTSSSTSATAVTPSASSQTITYAGAGDTALSTGSVSVTASASSGLPVTLTSTTTGVCTVSGTSPNFTLTLLAEGTCSTTASQAGDSTYTAATSVIRSFNVTSSGGGGGGGGSSTSETATVPTAKVTLCHRTRAYSNPYVVITVDQDAVMNHVSGKLEGHGIHFGPVFPAADWGDIIPPFDGYAGYNWDAEGQAIYANGCDMPDTGKVTLCHRTSSTTNPYVLITVDQNAVLKRGHDGHTGGLYPTPGWGDIIPPFPGYAGMNWPAGQQILDDGCSPNGPVDIESLPPEQPRCLADNSKQGPPLTRDQVVLKPGDSPNEVDIEGKDGEPLTLLSMQVNDPNNVAKVKVVSRGSNPKDAASWTSAASNDVCWTIGAFSGTDYSYTLPAPEPPTGANGEQWEYTKAVVSASGVSGNGSGGKAETVFNSPSAGDVVWADVNGNGIFDPSGLMSGRTNTQPVRDGKVTLCHRTRSKTNPYVEITVDKNAVLNQKKGKEEGHGIHTGPIFPDAGWGDIIPAFDDYPGMNWPAGRDILESGCNVDDGLDKPVSQVILCAKPVPAPTPGTPVVETCEAPITEPTPSASPSGSESSPAPSSSPSGSVASPAPSSSPSRPAPTSSTPAPSASPSPSTPTATATPTPSTSSTPSPEPSVATPEPTPPPIRIKVLPEPSPSPSTSTSTPAPSSSTSAPAATPSPSTSTSTSAPSPSSSTSTSTTASPSPTTSSSTSSPSASPSGSSSTTSPSPSTSTTAPTGATESGTPSPSDSGPSPSTSSPTSELTDSPSPSSSSSTQPPGSPESAPSDSPGTPGGDPTTPTGGGEPADDGVDTRAATVKFTVAQGDQTLTFVVPMTRMLAIAAEAGTVEPALADTGSSSTAPIAAAVVLAATGLMVLPAIRRRRVRG